MCVWWLWWLLLFSASHITRLCRRFVFFANRTRASLSRECCIFFLIIIFISIISPHVSFVQLRRPPPPQRITKTDKSQSFTMVLAATLRKFEMPHGRPIAFYVSRNTPSYRMVFDDSPWNSTEVCIFCIAFKHYLLI